MGETNRQKPYVRRRRFPGRGSKWVWVAWSTRYRAEYWFRNWADAMSCALDQPYPAPVSAQENTNGGAS